FAFALPLRDTFPDVWAEADGSEVTNSDGGSIFRGYRDCFEVAQGAQRVKAANQLFRPTSRKQPSTDFVRALTDFFDDRRVRDSVCATLVGIDVHLVLLHVAADGCDLGDAGHGFELIAQIPVLNAAKFGQTSLMCVLNKGVLIHPACP